LATGCPRPTTGYLRARPEPICRHHDPLHSFTQAQRIGVGGAAHPAVVQARPMKVGCPKESSMSKSKVFATVVLGLTGTLGVGVAQAGSADMQWSIMIGTPVYTQAVPVYVQPLPVYQRPAPVRVRPAPIYQRTVYLQPTRWDRDGDGIPNRHDRLYNPPWDRDGDGIPNRYERHTTRGWQAR
jgi:hypothetical protein